MYDLCLAEYKELWRVILAEYIDVEVQKRLSSGGGFPCLEGFSFSGTWCVQRSCVAECLAGQSAALCPKFSAAFCRPAGCSARNLR